MRRLFLILVLALGPALAGQATADVLPPAVKVVLVVLENTGPAALEAGCRDQRLRFLCRLKRTGAYLANYHAVAHPSQPNYVALISGSTAGIADDSAARIDRPHLGRKLDSWKAYAQGYPEGSCDLRPVIGRYARKHVPFLSFADVQDRPAFCRAHIHAFREFTSDAAGHRLPRFSLIVPDLDHDAHDRPLAAADAWLEQVLGPLVADARFRRDVLLIITFDEDDTPWLALPQTINRVATILWGDSVVQGEIRTAYNHYDLHRTIEAILGVPPTPGNPAARVIYGIWRQ